MRRRLATNEVERYLRWRRAFQCVRCEAWFTGIGGARFCSQDCYDADLAERRRRPPSTHVCACCGDSFEARADARFCSTRCRVAAHRDARR